MKISVPTNWQEDLIPQVKRDNVVELYGKLDRDFVGGGRPSFVLPHVNKSQAKRHIQEAHRNGLKFNYLLNALCLDNKEFTRFGQKSLHRLLDWLANCEVDSLTVSIPYLLQLIKKQYPKFRVYVSILANVNTPQRAKYWEDLGADGITLKNDLTRDFKSLESIRKRIKCGLQLIGNNGCLYHCPFWLYHSLLFSHASQVGHYCQGFMVEYCLINCRYLRLLEPMNFIRADWIRPEDISIYEQIGIDKIKLIDRTAPTEKIALIAKAYANGYYNGNLADLLPCISQDRMAQRPTLFRILRYMFRPFSINLFKFYKMQLDMSALEVNIDNQKLDGFIQHFIRENCNGKTCLDCGYCRTVAQNVVEIEPEYRSKMLARYKDIIEDFASSTIFRY